MTATYYSTFLESSFWLALMLPLGSALLSFIISERYSWVVSITAPLLMLLAAASATYVFSTLWNEAPYVIQWNWFSVASLQFTAGVYINNLSVMMLLLITLISFLVHLYSIGYMAGDQRIKRYFTMLGFFTFSMLGIVVSDSLLLIFIFWELVGFSSYMLIGHWQEKRKVAAASKKSFIFNRIGDAGFLIGLMVVWTQAETFSLQSLASVPFAGGDLRIQTIASLCIFCGVIGKSAQFPLLTWLPAAMEGPTPVSALIHAATMVAAGVFLLARVDFLFTAQAHDVVACVGIVTALMGALAALSQTDIKKILAFSTISQLGLMVTAAGAGSTDAAMLHLVTHAFFKACLFLCAGSIIHALHQARHEAQAIFDVQNIRNLGGLKKKLPFTFLAMCISGGALAGIPLLSGFVSKDAILTVLFFWKAQGGAWRNLVFISAFAVSFITVLYVFRMVWSIFFGVEKITKELSVMEPPVVMRLPIGLLAFGCFWFIASWNPLDFSGWLWNSNVDHSLGITMVSALWVMAAFAFAFYLYRYDGSKQVSLFTNSFYLDSIYRQVIEIPVMKLSNGTHYFDKKWIDGFLHASAYAQVTVAHLTGWFDHALVDGLVNGVSNTVRTIGSFTRSFQGGKIQLYIFWTIFATIIFLIWTLI